MAKQHSANRWDDWTGKDPHIMLVTQHHYLHATHPTHDTHPHRQHTAGCHQRARSHRPAAAAVGKRGACAPARRKGAVSAEPLGGRVPKQPATRRPRRRSKRYMDVLLWEPKRACVLGWVTDSCRMAASSNFFPHPPIHPINHQHQHRRSSCWSSWRKGHRPPRSICSSGPCG